MADPDEIKDLIFEIAGRGDIEEATSLIIKAHKRYGPEFMTEIMNNILPTPDIATPYIELLIELGGENTEWTEGALISEIEGLSPTQIREYIDFLKEYNVL